ncbi:MAG: hypothetical protein GF349_01045 [Candidatus Magasanikbacteria bacterium]|nr:hypothetical protein [Candidatus Magasanikbacteria bacterium]
MSFKIAVFGSAMDENENTIQKASELGQSLGKTKSIVITGACSGIPYKVAINAKRSGAEVWGFSPEVDIENQKQFTPNDDLSIYGKIIYVDKKFAENHDKFARRKYRNVLSTSECDSGIIIAGRWGTLNEFTNLIDMGKVIGILTETGGIADELYQLNKKINKQTKSILIFENSPELLVQKIIQQLNSIN